ncbi:hypothetical protein [Cohnella cellulosilytica]|uniref:Uncharacterized protein n=1 Tax=Cohnella cellulosilytica TaxID=986710 RepID=A0ABW2F6T6_9BACL
MSDQFKKNLGNQIAKKGEEFVEETLKNNIAHPAMNNPARPNRIRRG